VKGKSGSCWYCRLRSVSNHLPRRVWENQTKHFIFPFHIFSHYITFKSQHNLHCSLHRSNSCLLTTMAMASAKLNTLSSQWIAHSTFSPRRGSSPRRVSLPIRASSYQHELVQTAVSTNTCFYLLLSRPLSIRLISNVFLLERF